nr:MAG TPA: hypothetical protein [Caudoviricetes sp.]
MECEFRGLCQQQQRQQRESFLPGLCSLENHRAEPQAWRIFNLTQGAE